MQKTRHPLVAGEVLQVDGSCIALDSVEWLEWLARGNQFRYSDGGGHFMAQCEIRRGRPYWYAYRRQNGKLSKVYLGKSEELTSERLKAACLAIAGGKSEVLAAPAPNPPARVERLSTNLLPFAKINGPVPPPHLVLRPRLTRQITTPVTLVNAPSGFGKSTLINEWKQSCSFPVAWLSLDVQDNQPLRFWNSVVLAVQTAAPEFGKKLLLYLNGTNSYHLAETVTMLLNEMAQVAAGLPALGLVIDDVHHIHNSEVLDTLQLCIDHLPPKVHLVLSGRTRLPLAYGQLRARGMITELETQDLRFTQDEAVFYIKEHINQVPLAAEDITKLTKHTEGWAAGLRLSVLAMNREGDQRQFIDTFSGAHIYIREYFLEAVLQRTSPEVQYFLLRTAILKHLTGSLCDALTGWKNGEKILAQLWQNNLFVEKLEQPGWYRYHDLFSEMLSSQLQANYPEEVPQLHRKAAQWYRERFALGDAVNHLLAIQAWEEAAALIEEVALHELEQNGEDSRLLRWLESLPENVVQKHKNLLFVYLSLASSAFSRKKIERFVAKIEMNLSLLPEAQLSSAEREVLAEVRRLRAAWESGKPQQPLFVSTSQDEDRQALYRYFQDVYFSFSAISRERAESLPILLERGRKMRNLFMIVMAGGALSQSAYIQGQLRYAERNARQVLDDARALRGSLPEPASISLAVLGLVCMMRFEIEAAQSYLNQAGEVDPDPTSTNMTILLAIMRAKIQVLLRNFEAARELLEAARELLLRRPANTWTEQDLLAYMAFIHVRSGDLNAAQHILAGSDPAAVHPLSRLVQAELDYARGNYPAVEASLVKLLADYERGLHYEPLFDARVLLALALFKQHKVHQACQVLAELLRKVAQEHIILPLIERGADLTMPLALVLATENLNRETRGFAQALINRLPNPGGAYGLNEQSLVALSTAASISPREQEILRLISTGLSVREMAQRLCLAESTVKTHLGNIYQKLGARSRTQAINRARELELIQPQP